MVSHLLLSYALLIYNTGVSAGDIVYVETGSSVQLDIQREKLTVKFDDIIWKNERSQNLVRYLIKSNDVKPHSSYINRMDFNTETFSLTLKNIQKNESGIYRAIASSENDINIAEYKVSVIDGVKVPVLTVNSNWSINEPCNFTCTADNLTIINYYNSSCSDEVKSFGIYNLNLKCTDDFIICNYSNPVSWKKDTKTVQQLCNVIPVITSGAGSILLHWLIPLFCLSLGLFGVVGFGFYKNRKGRLLNALHLESTVYANVENPPATEKSNKDNPVSIYSTIEPQPIPPTCESEKTVYAMVNKHPAGNESVQLQ